VCFPLNVSVVHSLKLVIITDSEDLTDISFTHGETIHFGSLEFIANHFSNLSLFDEGKASGAMFVGMAHNGSPSLHTILEDSADEGDTTSSGGGSTGFPISLECNVVTPTIHITTTQPPEGIPSPLTIAIAPLWITIP
jgi:hypothetical protein